MNTKRESIRLALPLMLILGLTSLTSYGQRHDSGRNSNQRERGSERGNVVSNRDQRNDKGKADVRTHDESSRGNQGRITNRPDDSHSARDRQQSGYRNSNRDGNYSFNDRHRPPPHHLGYRKDRRYSYYHSHHHYYPGNFYYRPFWVTNYYIRPMVRHLYLPEYNCYYDLYRGGYTWYGNGSWWFSFNLPVFLSDVSWSTTRIITFNEDIDRPWDYNRQHVKVYSGRDRSYNSLAYASSSAVEITSDDSWEPTDEE
mgnify:CR=1 FL=1